MSPIIEKISKSTLRFLSPSSIGDTYSAITEEAVQLVGAKYGSLYTKEGLIIKRVFTTNEIVNTTIPRKRGFIYQTFKKPKPFVINKEILWKIHPEMKDRGVRSVIFVPLSYAKKTLGVLALQLSRKEKLDKEELKALKLFGSLASLAIRKTQLYAETKKVKKDRDAFKSLELTLEEIHNSSLKFLAPLTPERTYETITQEAVKLVGAEYGSILLGVKGELERVYASNQILYKIIPRRRGLIYEVFRTQQPAILKARELEGVRERHPALREISTRSIILIPLSYRGESLGVLTVQAAKTKSFTASELNTLKLFGSLASLAIRKTQLYAETKEALELRDSFFAIAAHELRTPLTTIYGYAQLLQNKLPKNNSSETRWIKEIVVELVRLTKLVNGLISVNKIRANELQYIWRHCHISEILSRALADFATLHPDRKVIVKKTIKEEDDIIVGDFEKLEQVLLNILDNAAKFSPDDKEIDVRLGTSKDNVVLTVKDKGRGIDKKDIHKVIGGFYKGEENFEEGMGMGLFLTKHFINKHKGEIEIVSELGKGTSVIIRIPKAEQ